MTGNAIQFETVETFDFASVPEIQPKVFFELPARFRLNLILAYFRLF